MAKISKIQKDSRIERRGTNNFILIGCIDCGKERWVKILRNKPKSPRCRSCANRLIGLNQKPGNAWKGGRIKALKYIRVYFRPDDFFYSMADKKGYVLEHRLVVAKALGRCLQPWEIVHHKEGFAKDDNRYPEVLQLVTDDRHKQITLLENRIRQLEQRVLILEAENVLLKVEVTGEKTKIK